jgi:hypothetical protein
VIGLTKTLEILIEVPDTVSDDLMRLAEMEAKEAAILFLQQQGVLTIREAAAALGLAYEGYLQVLSQRGLPASSDDIDPTVLDTLRQELRQHGGPFHESCESPIGGMQ